MIISPIIGKIDILKNIKLFTITWYDGQFRPLGVKNASLLVFCVSCLCPWARQNFPAPLKIEQTLSHG